MIQVMPPLLLHAVFDGGYFGQYIAYLRHLFAGDWGRSLLDGAPVFEQLIVRFGASLEIMLLALLVAWFPGVAFGRSCGFETRPVSGQYHSRHEHFRLFNSSFLGLPSSPFFWSRCNGD